MSFMMITMLILLIVVKALISAGVLFAACKLAGHWITFPGALTVAVATSVAAVIPYVGWLLALVLFFVLITRLTDAGLFSALWIAVLNLFVALLVTAAGAMLIDAVVRDDHTKKEMKYRLR